MTSDRTLVLVHGAFHGGWCFELLRPILDRQGITTITLDLPLTSLRDDAAAVTDVLDDLPDGVALLGHSYGGAVITEAGNHPQVRSLIYLAALAPDGGTGVADAGPGFGGALLDALIFRDDGLLSVDPDRAPDIFYPDAESPLARQWAARLRSGGVGLGEQVREAAWQDRDSSYIICLDDPIVSPALQRSTADRIGATVYELPGDHSPFLAQPAALATLLEAMV